MSASDLRRESVGLHDAPQPGAPDADADGRRAGEEPDAAPASGGPRNASSDRQQRRPRSSARPGAAAAACATAVRASAGSRAWRSTSGGLGSIEVTIADHRQRRLGGRTVRGRDRGGQDDRDRRRSARGRRVRRRSQGGAPRVARRLHGAWTSPASCARSARRPISYEVVVDGDPGRGARRASSRRSASSTGCAARSSRRRCGDRSSCPRRRYCPVSAMLSAVARVEHRYRLVDESGGEHEAVVAVLGPGRERPGVAPAPITTRCAARGPRQRLLDGGAERVEVERLRRRRGRSAPAPPAARGWPPRRRWRGCPATRCAGAR